MKEEKIARALIAMAKELAGSKGINAASGVDDFKRKLEFINSLENEE